MDVAIGAVGFHLVLVSPLRLPAVVHALSGAGQATIGLLPSVQALESTGMSPAEVDAAVALVQRERDRLLAAWLGDGTRPVEPPATGAPPTEPRAASASYDAKSRRIVLHLVGGSAMSVPIKVYGPLAQATDEQLAVVEVLAAGAGLRFPGAAHVTLVGHFLLAATGGEGYRRHLLGAGQPKAWQARPDGENGELRLDDAFAPPPAPSAPLRIKSLLGLILQREGYLEGPQLQAIFQEQQRRERAGEAASFGRIAVESGQITQAQLSFAIQLQERLAHTAGQGKPLGVYLLENSAVTPSTLLSALDEQAQTGQRLGELLVRRSAISQDLLDTFLRQQGAVRSAAQASTPAPEAPASAPAAPPTPATPRERVIPASTPAPDPAAPAATAPAENKAQASVIRSLLGMILERENYLSGAQVRDVLAGQEALKKEGKTRTFGEHALEMGLITPEQLKFAVTLQKRLAYAPNKPKPLGIYLLENGVVKPSQLQSALDEAVKSQKRLGEVLIEQGLISESLLTVFLGLQSQQGE